MPQELCADKIARHMTYLAHSFGFHPLWAAAAVFGDAVQRTFLYSQPKSVFKSALFLSPEPYNKIDCSGAMIHHSFMFKAGFGTEPVMKAVLCTQKFVDAYTQTLPSVRRSNDVRLSRQKLLPCWHSIDGEKLKLLCFKVRADLLDPIMRAARECGQNAQASAQVEDLTFSALNQLVQKDLKVKEIVLIPSIAGYTATSVPVTYSNVESVRNRISRKHSVSAHL